MILSDLVGKSTTKEGDSKRKFLYYMSSSMRTAVLATCDGGNLANLISVFLSLSLLLRLR